MSAPPAARESASRYGSGDGAEHLARIAPSVAAGMRATIRLAGGREVCFVATVDAEGVLRTARAVSRGDVASVLALPAVAERGEMLVHNHPSGLLEPSDADLSVAARLHDGGIGFGIIDNDATELYVVVEVPRAREIKPIEPLDIANALGPHGLVAAKLARYEDRPAQREMASEIARLYNDGGIALLEAGTGVGKSLGYLVPALRWAAANGERTVVSTNTINLQEQLVGKDLPFLRDALTDQPCDSRCSRDGETISVSIDSSRRRARDRGCSPTAPRTSWMKFGRGRSARRMDRWPTCRCRRGRKSGTRLRRSRIYVSGSSARSSTSASFLPHGEWRRRRMSSS